MRRQKSLLYCLLILSLLWAAVAAAGDVRRIVSINLCTDQLLLLLAPREHIVSLSFMADNPVYSAYAEQVEEIPLNHARVEEIVALQPDLVLAYELSDRQLVGFLRQLGYPVVVVPAPASFEDIESTYLTAARALGAEQRGRQLLSRMALELEALEPLPTEAPLAVIYGPNGYSPGGETLQGAVLEAAGMRNLSRVLGNEHGATIPLEQILGHRPQVFILSDEEANADSLAQRKLQHPALQRQMRRAKVAQVTGRFWSCPTPRLLEAVDELRDAMS